MTTPLYKENQELIYSIAHKFMTRVKAKRMRIDFNDVCQELSLTWVKCEKTFKPESGVKFTTYFYNAAGNNLNLYYKRQIPYNANEFNVDYEPLNSDEEDELTDLPLLFEDVVGNASDLVEDVGVDYITPELIVSEVESIDRRISGLTMDALKVVNALTNPSALILKNISVKADMAIKMKTQGIHGPCKKERNSIPFICHLFGFTPEKGRRIRSEIYEVLSNDYR